MQSLFSGALVSQISGLVAKYISDQRQLYRPRGVPLTAAQIAKLRSFFREDLLQNVRVLRLQDERVANPAFYPMVKSLGFVDLPDQTTAAATTFSDVIVSHNEFSNGLLFHELVHVEQYRQLGISRFAELYVRGFLTGGGHSGIPLEVNAYALGARYEAAPGVPFSVADEVSQWLLQGKL